MSEETYDDGYDEGFEDGHQEGYDEGYADGYKIGWDDCPVKHSPVEDELMSIQGLVRREVVYQGQTVVNWIQGWDYCDK